MKNANAHQRLSKKKLALKAPSFPSKTDSIRAAVLWALIKGEVVAGMNDTFAQSPARLALAVRALENEYGWKIERRKKPVTMKDGRNVWVNAYSLASPFYAWNNLPLFWLMEMGGNKAVLAVVGIRNAVFAKTEPA